MEKSDGLKKNWFILVIMWKTSIRWNERTLFDGLEVETVVFSDKIFRSRKRMTSCVDKFIYMINTFFSSFSQTQIFKNKFSMIDWKSIQKQIF